MYGHEPPDRLNPDQIAAKEACPASIGPGSDLPRATLDRWLAVRTALEGALANGGDIDRAVRENTEWLDAVQTEIVIELVTNGVAVLGAEDAMVEWDPEDSPALVPHPRINAEFASYFQVEVSDPRDPSRLERLKIRSGRRGTSPAEAAVLLEGSESGVSCADLMLRTGTVEPIEMDPADRAETLTQLAELAEVRATNRDRVPGLHCYSCSRVARCGQFPAPPGYRVGSSERTIRMSRTDLLGVAECERRVAWKVLYGIPKEESEDTGDAAAIGLLFHEFIARALMSQDPDAEFARQLEQVAPGDAAMLANLYERHQSIESEHEAVTYRRVEYEIGVTIPLRGRSATRNGDIRENQPVSIVVIARADAVGREADNTPAIIEHRTGKNSDRIDERETALYALSTARLLGVERVAVHQHALGAEGDPKCERILYDSTMLADAEALLERTLSPVLSWHPLDSTHPPFVVEQWCGSCPFIGRCDRHR